MPERRTAAVIGTGYVGLPAALLMARAGHEVLGVDIDEGLVRAINNGALRLDHDELQALLDEPEVRRNLRATTQPEPADAFLIAVPTPLEARRKVADLSMVIDAVESIVPHLREGSLVVLESTVPPGTCREVITPLLNRSGLVTGETVFLAHCPERILPGDVFREIVHNDRVIGSRDPKARRMAADLYRTFVEGELLLTDDVTAELVKLMENTHRDVNIALANELAAVCATFGVDAEEAIKLANRHPRVSILSPGIGVGGHCIPIDPWFIAEVDPANSQLIQVARRVNEAMPGKVAGHIRRAVAGVEAPKIVALGATYKPNVEDVRGSPALEIVRLLREDGYDVRHLDPLVAGMGYHDLPTACAGADCVAVLVEHDSIVKTLDTEETEVLDAMRRPVLLRF